MANLRPDYKTRCYKHTRYSQSVLKFSFTEEVSTTSKFNTTGHGVKPASAHGWALIHMLFNEERHIGIAKCDARNELLLEIKSSHTDTRKLLIFNYKDNTLACGALNENDEWADRQEVSAEYVATLHLAYLIYSDSEVSAKWRDTQTEFVQKNKKQRITDSIGPAYLLDALYFSIDKVFPNFDMESGIIPIDDSTNKNGFEDITNEILGFSGEFHFATITSSKKVTNAKNSKPSLESLKAQYGHLTAEFFAGLSDVQKALIPKLKGTRLENYIVTDEFTRDIAYIANAIEEKDMYGMSEILVGPPGLGKSLAAYATAYIFNWPLYYIQGNKDVTAADFIGAPIADNGVLRTDTDTPLLKAMRDGGLCLLDDFTYINEGYTTTLLSVFDNPFSIKAADETIVNRHPMCFMFVTANPDCYGSRPMNEAIRSRGYIFHNKCREDITADQIIDMVMDASKYPIRKDVETMFTCYELICNDVKGNSSMMGLAVEPCIRNLIHWAKQARVLKNPLLAALDNIIPSLGVSREEERRIYTSILVPRFNQKYSK